MPIKSYLAHPIEGQKKLLINELSKIDKVEVIPGENKDVVIVITETEDNKEEDLLKEELEAVKGMKLLAMVSGFKTPKQ